MRAHLTAEPDNQILALCGVLAVLELLIYLTTFSVPLLLLLVLFEGVCLVLAFVRVEY